MVVELDPITIERMTRFERRRRRMLASRALLSAIVAFIVTMSLIVLVDYLIVLADSTRWTLSLSAYVVVAVATWLAGLRQILTSPSRKDLARMIESAEPELREQLLAAVELETSSNGSSEPIADSAQFRQIVQSDVAEKIGELRVATALPAKLLRGWAVVAVILVVACMVLLNLPGSPFSQLLTRAVLPGANVARVSRTQIEIVSPAPASALVPQGEPVAILVELKGRVVDDATLEVTRGDNEAERFEMNRGSVGQFSLNVNVSEETVVYRVLAGDGVTQRYRLNSHPRPYVKSFVKTYNFPEYAQLPPREIVEETGDLKALQGSTADVEFQLDQAVTSASVRITRPGSSDVESIEAKVIAGDRIQAQIPIGIGGVYKVHLTSAETNFENTFSPKYEIISLIDLSPRADWLGQDKRTLFLPPNDFLEMVGSVEDDLPLVSAVQEIQVNDGPWESFSFPLDSFEQNTERKAIVQRNWDLLDLKLEAGDLVTTKLVATDRKGNQGESVPLSIVIAKNDFDPDRHATLERKASCYDALLSLADEIERGREVVMTTIDQLEGNELTQVQRGLHVSNLLELAERTERSSQRTLEQLAVALSQMPSNPDAYEMELISRSLASIPLVEMRRPRHYLELAQTAPDEKTLSEELAKVEAVFRRSAEYTRRIERAFRKLLTFNVALGILQDMLEIQEYQKNAITLGDIPRERLIRNQRVVTNLMRLTTEFGDAHRMHIDNSFEGRLNSNLTWLDQTRDQIETAMGNDEVPEDLAAKMRSSTSLLNSRRFSFQIPNNVTSLGSDGRNELHQILQSRSVSIHRLAQTLREQQKWEKKLAQHETPQSLRIVETYHVNAMIDELAVKLPSVDATLNDSSPLFDPLLAADARLAHSAMRGLLLAPGENLLKSGELPNAFDEIGRAYAALETGHELATLKRLLDQLIDLERWHSQSELGKNSMPRLWFTVQPRWIEEKTNLERTGFPKSTSDKIARLARNPQSKLVDRVMRQRQAEKDESEDVDDELFDIQVELDAILDELQPRMLEARELISKYVREISELAEAAREEAEVLESQTVAVAENADQQEASANEQEIDQLLDAEEELRKKLADLFNALLDKANKQDLFSDEGIEQARDADDAMAMLQDAAQDIKESLDQAADATGPREQETALENAALEQSEAIETLQKIAEHYKKLENGEDVAETREALRDAESQLALEKRLDDQFAPSQQLVDMAHQSQQDLLAQLEAELQVNPEMQNALSDISQDVLEDAKETLEQAANDERNERRALERSDKGLAQQKQTMDNRLRTLTASTRQLSQELQQTAANAAQAQVEEARSQLQLSGTRTREVADELGIEQRENRNPLAEEIAQQAEKLGQRLDESAKEISEAREKLKAAVNEPTAEDDNARKTSLANLNRQLTNKHRVDTLDAKNSQRVADQALRNAERMVVNEQRKIAESKRRLKSAEDRLKKDSDNRGHLNSVNQAKRQIAVAEQAKEAARSRVDGAKVVAKEAKERVRRVAANKPKPLNAANPSAQLAEMLANQQAAEAAELAQAAKQLAEEAKAIAAHGANASTSQLSKSEDAQQQIGEQVQSASADLQRAARHEERLGNKHANEALAQRAEQLEAVTDNEVADAKTRLGQAAAINDAQGSERAIQQVRAVDAVEQAELAISDQAKRLEEMSATADAGAQVDSPSSGEPSNSASQSTGQPSIRPSAAEQGQVLAETLDELDQALAEGSSEAGTPADSTGLSSLSKAAESQAAAIAQARQQQGQGVEVSLARTALSGEIDLPAGANLAGADMPVQSLQRVSRDDAKDWGKLPPKLAKDLVEGSRESVSSEYREQIETYFRVIAEQAGKKNDE